MKYKASNPEEYISQFPEDRQAVITKMRDTINGHLPTGFQEAMSYGMIGWVVPHSLYPGGYHCDPKLPLPFMSIASQKNFVALYHMGVYSHPALMEWFVTEYPKHVKTKLDMGKSCIRFKKMDQVPYDLIAELTARVSVEDWVGFYENSLQR